LQDFFPESRVNLELRPPNPTPFQQSSPLPPPPLHSELPEPELQSQQENPAAATVSSSPPDKMAYQFVDPTPFIPRGFQRVVVPNCKAMSRVILGRPARRNPDVVIVTINPLPQHQVAFNTIRDVLHEFLHDHARVGYTYIQPCPFGQAYVKFIYFHDRDQLIHNSPHQFGDVYITFIEHDRGINHRAVTLNHEVWLMLLGTNIDFWSDVHMNKILGDHGHIIAWEEDPNHIARVLLKARVVNLEEIPWFIVNT
jgi:hypothetical protein